jgi:membrane fusion protein, multidrug efflux system
VFTAQAANSSTQYERSRTLFADDRNISQKNLRGAQALMQADDAKRQSAESTLNGLEGAALVVVPLLLCSYAPRQAASRT